LLGAIILDLLLIIRENAHLNESLIQLLSYSYADFVLDEALLSSLAIKTLLKRVLLQDFQKSVQPL